jgi:hypothetical protein
MTISAPAAGDLNPDNHNLIEQANSLFWNPLSLDVLLTELAG